MDTPKPILMPLEENQFLLVKDLKCDNVTIPRGFVSDLASIPRFFWRIIGSNAETERIWQAIRHDFRYRTQTISRKEADVEFRDSLSGFSRYIIYSAVRSVGWIAWNSYTKAIKKHLPCEEEKVKKQGCKCKSDHCCNNKQCCWKQRIKGKKR